MFGNKDCGKECGENVAMLIVVEKGSGVSSDRFKCNCNAMVFSMFMKLGGSKKIHKSSTEEINTIQRLGEVI